MVEGRKSEMTGGMVNVRSRHVSQSEENQPSHKGSGCQSWELFLQLCVVRPSRGRLNHVPHETDSAPRGNSKLIHEGITADGAGLKKCDNGLAGIDSRGARAARSQPFALDGDQCGVIQITDVLKRAGKRPLQLHSAQTAMRKNPLEHVGKFFRQREFGLKGLQNTVAVNPQFAPLRAGC